MLKKSYDPLGMPIKGKSELKKGKMNELSHCAHEGIDRNAGNRQSGNELASGCATEELLVSWVKGNLELLSGIGCADVINLSAERKGTVFTHQAKPTTLGKIVVNGLEVKQSSLCFRPIGSMGRDGLGKGQQRGLSPQRGTRQMQIEKIATATECQIECIPGWIVLPL